MRKTERLVGKIDRFSGQASGEPDGLWVVHIDGSVPRPREDRGFAVEGACQGPDSCAATCWSA